MKETFLSDSVSMTFSTLQYFGIVELQNQPTKCGSLAFVVQIRSYLNASIPMIHTLYIYKMGHFTIHAIMLITNRFRKKCFKQKLCGLNKKTDRVFYKNCTACNHYCIFRSFLNLYYLFLLLNLNYLLLFLIYNYEVV